jgi:hypothetical protein
MITFKKAAIALSLAAAVVAVASPSFAQTTRAQRAAAAQAQMQYGTPAQVQYDTMRWQRAPMTYGLNAYALENGSRQLDFDPNTCVSDEGYGRISPCPNGE